MVAAQARPFIKIYTGDLKVVILPGPTLGNSSVGEGIWCSAWLRKHSAGGGGRVRGAD